MNTLTMFVIRRKSDGMFVGSKDGWTKSMVKARTFKNKGGAKNSRPWSEFKNFTTEHACSDCRHSQYGRWNHIYQEDRPNTRYYGRPEPKETREQWIAKHNRLPCSIRRRLTAEENPLEVVPITFSIQS